MKNKQILNIGDILEYVDGELFIVKKIYIRPQYNYLIPHLEKFVLRPQ